MMKRISMLLVALIFTASTAAQARDHGREHREPPRDGAVAMEMLSRMHHALKRLDLSGEQKAAIRSEFREMKGEMKPLAEALRDNRAKLHGLLIADEYDAAAVSGLADEQGRITADMIRLAGATIHSAMGELTDAQRDRLAEMREEHRQRLQEQLGHLQQRIERLESAD